MSGLDEKIDNINNTPSSMGNNSIHTQSYILLSKIKNSLNINTRSTELSKLKTDKKEIIESIIKTYENIASKGEINNNKGEFKIPLFRSSAIKNKRIMTTQARANSTILGLKHIKNDVKQGYEVRSDIEEYLNNNVNAIIGQIDDILERNDYKPGSDKYNSILKSINN